MFKLLRSKAKVFYWVIAASFILFIFLAWGMDFTGVGGGQPRQDTGVMGSVNGLPITAYEYDSAVQGYLGRLRQQDPNRELTAGQLARVREDTWNALVQDRIEESAVRELGLTATRDDILYVLRNSPPPELLQAYTNESGQPDLQRYFADLQDPSRDWTGVEDYLRRQLPRQKLRQIIVSAAVVTDAEVQQAFQQRNGRTVAEYLGVLYDGITVPEPTDAEVQTWYDEHKGLYHQDKRARVSLVAWPKEASEMDEQEVLQLAREVKQTIQSGEMGFPEAAAVYSEDATAESGGDLGTFDRQRMVPEFTTAAFSLPVGQISDPVRTQFGYHLIEVLDREVENGEVARVHARHILLKVKPGADTTTRLFERADRVRGEAVERGLESAAAADSARIQGPQLVREGQELPGVPQSMEGSYFAFRAAAGDVSPVFETDDHYYIVRVDSVMTAGAAPLPEVRHRVVLDLKNERKRELARQRLAPALAAAKASGDWAAVAAQHGLLHAVTDTLGFSTNVPEVGFGTAFNAVALEIGAGEVVPEVETPRGLFALRSLWKRPLNEQEFAQQAIELRARLLQSKQQTLLETWFEDRISQAEIVDHRDERRGGDV